MFYNTSIGRGLPCLGFVCIHNELQQLLDGAVIAGAREPAGQIAAAQSFFNKSTEEFRGSLTASFSLEANTLTGKAAMTTRPFLGGLLMQALPIAVTSKATFANGGANPCIIVLPRRLSC